LTKDRRWVANKQSDVKDSLLYLQATELPQR